MNRNDVQRCQRAGFNVRDGHAYLPAPWGTAQRWKKEAHGKPVEEVSREVLRQEEAEEEQ